ncbi:hypothetical protein C7999DRAFT_42951 [Corynascus novoguineensis]|uniref:Uncharacterized protein n=1 Tax=Corynascus novoguineensis TaxID=1126955 RepID=A0AAN7HL76_9PEZI|nr:hypothetical protein C7999DRAFT_42951 [Corynascus novoguineensis]
MELQSPQQGAGEAESRPMTPSYDSPYYHGPDDVNPDNATTRGVNTPIPSRPRGGSPGYTSHVRSASGTIWDGSPSPLPQPQVRRSNKPRPSSAISFPDYRALEYGSPAVFPDRWSYDRKRMPSPSPPRAPSAPSSRPGTPAVSDYGDISDTGFSRPASTFVGSRSSSRRPSLGPSSSVELTDINPSAATSSTPTVKVMPPPPPVYGDSQDKPQLSPHFQRSYHFLTDEEMEMLSRPPPTQPPMTASSLPPPPSPSFDKQESILPNPANNGRRNHPGRNGGGGGGEIKVKPGCTGMCHIAPAQAVLGKFGAWLMGVVLPVSFGLLTGCIASMLPGR